MLKILEKVCAKIEVQGKVNPDHLERIVEFFRVFADRYHHLLRQMQGIYLK